MGTLYDYLNWRGDLTFSQAPMNEVDSLIFSMLTYLDMKGIVPDTQNGATVPIKAAANAFFAQNPNEKKISLGLIVPKEIVKLFRAVKSTRRYANVGMRAFVNVIDTKKEMQFSAVTFLPDDGTALVAYRGTDDTLIGWKENFNMSFLPVVPAQLAAAEYLDDVAAHFMGNIRLTGHSKGGNLAVYAATHCKRSVRSRILQVWSNDGPGFGEGTLSDPDYIEMRPVIKSLVPQSSVVGMLLEHEEDYEVIKSAATGLLQHQGHTWEVMGGSFLHLDTVTESSKLIDEKLKAWLGAMSPSEREAFADTVFDTLSATNAKTLTELTGEKVKLVKAWNSLDPSTRSVILKCIAILVKHNAVSIVKK